ncbi:DNA topoisomerase III [Aneurinibacillus sp. Ricciae_BoGa-3]|uniref:DNA topoisomerase III n=1 Tax=Aneurinibacillus sp. Ricciae_BoGa-3 TaxID=3022697 RepID=UPI00233FC53E|nr:DNA topoisomerase III [Aneurinibacillus sp. Ricciae_BoGa-3]WCK56216.1 DNA topoisomerase III [Aneurinibacillus sp. Ricciae_BoGa-3]
MKSLVLAEKPSVAREIARVLGCTQKNKAYIEGPKYVVTWALGHLVTLAEPEDYHPKYKTWNLEDLPILPEHMKLKILKETSHQFKAVQYLAKRNDLSELIIATDAGREGELVARWIMELINWKKPFKRLWISSQTDKAIKEGFAQLKPGKNYNALYDSAVCRAEADWLIGLNVTRALTSKFNAQLAAGRVQTPTLAMMVQRENEIKNFKPVEYWTLQADFGTFTASWRDAGTNEARLFDRQKAESIQRKVEGAQAHIADIKVREKIEPQPLAYDLTELQRDANRRYGFSAKQTSNVLQRLYEQHKLVTYPRTDSRHLTTDMVPTLKARLDITAVGPYASLIRPLLKKELPITKRIVDDSKVTDHHAIIPTEERVDLGALSNDERKLYDLIVRRFIALFYPVYKYDAKTITVEVAGETFTAQGKTVRDSGWKAVYGGGHADSMEEDGDEPEDQELPDVKTGAAVHAKSCGQRSQLTKPPQRYSEAMLLTQMEKNNLGTPATRADIIEKLLQSDTIERQGGRLFPTKKGLQLMDLVAGELRSPELTAKWEKELESIARGRGNSGEFIKGIRQQTIEMVKTIKTSETEYKPHNVTGSRCPDCGQYLQEFKGKRGKMLICPDRSCGYKRTAEKQLSNHRCPQCHKKMEIRTGKAGKYFQCKSCSVIEMLEDKSGGSKINKRQERELVKKYSSNEGFTSSLGDLLKAALEKQND